MERAYRSWADRAAAQGGVPVDNTAHVRYADMRGSSSREPSSVLSSRLSEIKQQINDANQVCLLRIFEVTIAFTVSIVLPYGGLTLLTGPKLHAALH